MPCQDKLQKLLASVHKVARAVHNRIHAGRKLQTIYFGGQHVYSATFSIQNLESNYVEHQRQSG